MEVRKEKILVISMHPSSFVIKDIDILREKFQVKTLTHRNTKGVSFGLELILFAFLTLVYNIRGYKKIFSVFADSHLVFSGVLSVLKMTELSVVIGGYEVNTVPEINYGGTIKLWRASVIFFVLRRARHLLPVSDRLSEKCIKIRGQSDGVITVFNGFDTKVLNVDAQVVRRPSSVLSVAGVSNERTFILKGFDKVIEFARGNTRIEFTVAGVSDEARYLFPDLPNLKVIGFLSGHSLITCYQSHSYFLLSSISEGMPNVLCEAIFCGCTPIVTRAGNAPYIVGSDTLVMEESTLEVFNKTYAQAELMSTEEKTALRTRANGLFDIKERKEKLIMIMSIKKLPFYRG